MFCNEAKKARTSLICDGKAACSQLSLFTQEKVTQYYVTFLTEKIKPNRFEEGVTSCATCHHPHFCLNERVVAIPLQKNLLESRSFSSLDHGGLGRK